MYSNIIIVIISACPDLKVSPAGRASWRRLVESPEKRFVIKSPPHPSAQELWAVGTMCWAISHRALS